MDDYIRRTDVIAELNAEGYTKNTRFHKRFLTIPAAEVRPVKEGHWLSEHDGSVVSLGSDGCPEISCHCSECGDWLTGSDEYDVKGRFCPNCGAKMGGTDGRKE